MPIATGRFGILIHDRNDGGDVLWVFPFAARPPGVACLAPSGTATDAGPLQSGASP